MRLSGRRAVIVMCLVAAGLASWGTAAWAQAETPAQQPAATPQGGGEASLILPDLGSVSFMGVPGDSLLLVGLLVSALGLIFGLVIQSQLRKMAVQVDAPAAFKLRLRCVFSGGEKVTPEIARWTRERLRLPINEVYGQTEANILIGENDRLIPPREEPLGKPYPGHDVAIVDDDGRPLPSGALGNIAVRRGDPVIMLGYWNRPDATRAAYRGEWFVTGDLGMADEEGWIHYKGRADDVINSAGFRIGPAEVEGCLLQHEAVEQCAVVGVPDDTRGEAVKAFVLLRPGVARTAALADELARHVRTHLGSFQRPREIEWVDELPMTVSGKIKRADLRRRPESRA